MDSTLLTTMMLAALCGAGAVSLLFRRLAGHARNRFRQRHLLRRVGGAGMPATAGDEVGAVAVLGQTLMPARAEEVAAARARLSAAGFRRERHLGFYYLIRYAGTAAGLATGAVLWLFGALPAAAAFALPLGFLYGPDLLLRALAERRLRRVDQALPEFIDMCSVCMGAGMGWLAAVRRVATEMERLYPALCREFTYMAEQVKAGLPRSEALRQLADRNPSRDMRHLAQVLLQNERQGSPIVDSLGQFTRRVYAAREHRLEERAGKLSAKMALVIAPFMLFPFMLLLMGEQLTTLLRSLS